MLQGEAGARGSEGQSEGGPGDAARTPGRRRCWPPRGGITGSHRAPRPPPPPWLSSSSLLLLWEACARKVCRRWVRQAEREESALLKVAPGEERRPGTHRGVRVSKGSQNRSRGWGVCVQGAGLGTGDQSGKRGGGDRARRGHAERGPCTPHAPRRRRVRGAQRGARQPGGSRVRVAGSAGRSLPGRAHRSVAPSSPLSCAPSPPAPLDCRAQAPLSASRSLCDLNLPTKILR